MGLQSDGRRKRTNLLFGGIYSGNQKRKELALNPGMEKRRGGKGRLPIFIKKGGGDPGAITSKGKKKREVGNTACLTSTRRGRAVFLSDWRRKKRKPAYYLAA